MISATTKRGCRIAPMSSSPVIAFLSRLKFKGSSLKVWRYKPLLVFSLLALRLTHSQRNVTMFLNSAYFQWLLSHDFVKGTYVSFEIRFFWTLIFKMQQLENPTQLLHVFISSDLPCFTIKCGFHMSWKVLYNLHLWKSPFKSSRLAATAWVCRAKNRSFFLKTLVF